jgi:hypothetical protein
MRVRPNDSRQATVILVVSALLILLGTWLILSSLFWVRTQIRQTIEPKIQTYNGTTWEGDTCHVDSDGVLWCTESA